MNLCYPVAEPYQKVITQLFGENPDSYARFKLKGHNGLDFGVPLNTPIYAAASGIVVKVASDPGGYGTYIKIGHKEGVTLYAHLTCCLVSVGQKVDAGQVIARSGSTGNSTGPHLHFEYRPPGQDANGYGGAADPLPVLQTEAGSGAPAPDPVSPGVPRLYRVLQTVNVRSEPSTLQGSRSLVGQLPKGLLVGVYGDAAQWASLGNGLFCACCYGATTYLKAA